MSMANLPSNRNCKAPMKRCGSIEQQSRRGLSMCTLRTANANYVRMMCNWHCSNLFNDWSHAASIEWVLRVIEDIAAECIIDAWCFIECSYFDSCMNAHDVRVHTSVETDRACADLRPKSLVINRWLIWNKIARGASQLAILTFC